MILFYCNYATHNWIQLPLRFIITFFHHRKDFSSKWFSSFLQHDFFVDFYIFFFFIKDHFTIENVKICFSIVEFQWKLIHAIIIISERRKSIFIVNLLQSNFELAGEKRHFHQLFRTQSPSKEGKIKIFCTIFHFCTVLAAKKFRNHFLRLKKLEVFLLFTTIVVGHESERL